MARIVIADDHSVVRKGLRLILGDAEGIDVVGEASTADELLDVLRAHADSIDAVVLDVSFGDRDGIEVLKHIRSSWPRIPVLMMSMHAEQVFAMRAIRAGAAGYVEKSVSPEVLLDAVRRVASGKRYISPTLADRLLVTVARGPEVTLPHERLSDREFEIFRLLGAGISVSDIARSLNLSVKTVSTHRTRILEKTGLETNAEIINYVIENGLR